MTNIYVCFMVNGAYGCLHSKHLNEIKLGPFSGHSAAAVFGSQSTRNPVTIPSGTRHFSETVLYRMRQTAYEAVVSFV